MTVQDRVKELCNTATPCDKLQKWVRGYVPEHYKRLNIDMKEAYRLAKIGAKESLLCFNTTPFFTQAMLLGAVVDGSYNKVVVVTPSQYGKSWICGQIAIWLAFNERKVRLAGGDESTTEIIMTNVMGHMQHAHQEIKNKVLEYKDKVEKLQTSVSKKKLTFTGGGMIETITLGANVDDPMRFNKAIGRGGDYIIDECAMIPSDALAETGRREFSNKDGKKNLLFMISNPHKVGYFYNQLTDEEPEDDVLIVWMDVRTSLEEGNIPDVKRVLKSDFFKNDSTCQRYFLCELEEYSDYSMFKPMKLRDFGENLYDIFREEQFTFFLGVDSAYKGKDNIDICLSAMNKHGKVFVLDIQQIEKTGWEDGKTSEYVVKQILKVVEQFRVKYICVDVGYGVYIIENLAKYSDIYDFHVRGVNFGGGTTKERKKAKHFSAEYGANMRAELHLDLQSLMDTDKIFFTTRVSKMLEPQMAQVRSYIKGSNNKTAIMSKHLIAKKIGHSPDELDATLLSIHAMLLYNIGGGLFLYQNNDYYRGVEVNNV